ncbi:GH11935 [Drosophila grimshawi]|uniref:GH11935 n=1 Tax=Drosophila grimshawi TaxID=7222 RepID=B4K3R6_DROGR|nr:GH11935 [Drosophila grimshawi]
MKVEDYVVKNEKFTCNVENTILETFEPIPFADEGDEDALETLRSCAGETSAELLQAMELATRKTPPLAEAINTPLIQNQQQQQNRRGRLDKSHSTPAYDNSCEEAGGSSGGGGGGETLHQKLKICSREVISRN